MQVSTGALSVLYASEVEAMESDHLDKNRLRMSMGYPCRVGVQHIPLCVRTV